MRPLHPGIALCALASLAVLVHLFLITAARYLVRLCEPDLPLYR
jgi:hypothetical protein